MHFLFSFLFLDGEEGTFPQTPVPFVQNNKHKNCSTLKLIAASVLSVGFVVEGCWLMGGQTGSHGLLGLNRLLILRRKTKPRTPSRARREDRDLTYLVWLPINQISLQWPL